MKYTQVQQIMLSMYRNRALLHSEDFNRSRTCDEIAELITARIELGKGDVTEGLDKRDFAVIERALVRYKARAVDIQRLRDLLPPGSCVFSVLRSVARSGESQTIDLMIPRGDGGLRRISAEVGRVLDIQRPDGMALRINERVDAGYLTVFRLSLALHGYHDVGKNAIKAGDEGRYFRPTADEYRAGYSLRHERI